jgi:hypothetical protein
MTSAAAARTAIYGETRKPDGPPSSGMTTPGVSVRPSNAYVRIA